MIDNVVDHLGGVLRLLLFEPQEVYGYLTKDLREFSRIKKDTHS